MEATEFADHGSLAKGHQGHEQITGVGDAGIGQQALDVVLSQGHHVAYHHRESGQAPQDGGQAGGQAGEGGDEHAQQGGEAGGLGPHGHEAGHRGGRALVDVGGPHVEGHRRHLEAEADQEQAGADQQEQRSLAAAGHSRHDALQIGVGGGPVDQRGAVQHEAGSESPQQEVLQRGFFRINLRAGEAGEDVQGDGEHLEGQEYHDEVGGDRHEHHPADAEEQQHVIFPALDAGAAQVIVSQGHPGQAAGQEEHVQEDGEAVHGHHAAESGQGLAPLAQAQPQGDGQPQRGQQRRDALALPGDEQIHQKEHEGPDYQSNERKQCVKVVTGHIQSLAG